MLQGQRAACLQAGLALSAYRYKSTKDDQAALRMRLRELINAYSRRTIASSSWFRLSLGILG